MSSVARKGSRAGFELGDGCSIVNPARRERTGLLKQGQIVDAKAHKIWPVSAQAA
jgi:hypothetical protein